VEDSLHVRPRHLRIVLHRGDRQPRALDHDSGQREQVSRLGVSTGRHEQVRVADPAGHPALRVRSCRRSVGHHLVLGNARAGRGRGACRWLVAVRIRAPAPAAAVRLRRAASGLRAPAGSRRVGASAIRSSSGLSAAPACATAARLPAAGRATRATTTCAITTCAITACATTARAVTARLSAAPTANGTAAVVFEGT
jgi:hypothetical protein